MAQYFTANSKTSWFFPTFFGVIFDGWLLIPCLNNMNKLIVLNDHNRKQQRVIKSIRRRRISLLSPKRHHGLRHLLGGFIIAGRYPSMFSVSVMHFNALILVWTLFTFVCFTRRYKTLCRYLFLCMTGHIVSTGFYLSLILWKRKLRYLIVTLTSILKSEGFILLKQPWVSLTFVFLWT